MLDSQILSSLDGAVGRGLHAHNQFLTLAARLESETMPLTASLFHARATWGHTESLSLVRYTTGRGAMTTIPVIASPRSDFDDVGHVLQYALEFETALADELARVAGTVRLAGDFRTEQLLGSFARHQVAQIRTWRSLARVSHRCEAVPDRIEDWVRREHRSLVPAPLLEPLSPARHSASRRTGTRA